METNLTIVFPLYPGVTHLDFTGPHQFFSRLPGARVIVASLDGRPVSADGLVFSDLADLRTIPGCDLLCVPGGAGCSDALALPGFLEEVRRLAEGASWVTSVCTGSLLLAAAGLLRGRRAACHWAWSHLLPLFQVVPDSARVVRDGRFITGGGVTAGIDFALTVIAEVAGPEVAQRIQLGLEYAPQPPFQAGRPETAPPEVVEAYRALLAPAMAGRQAVFEAAARAQP